MKKLNKNLEKIITHYKKDLKNFIKENRLDIELYDDIDERLNEKLENIKEPKKEDILKILSEIGSPEEIFEQEIENQNSIISENQTFWSKLKARSNNVIFLGVFKELGDKTGISANIYRTIFLFLIFIGFVGNVSIIVSLPFLYFLGFLLLRTGIFRFLFSLFFGGICLFILVPSMILFGTYLGNFHIYNIYPFMEISYLFPIGMVIGIFSLIVLCFVFFTYAFTKKFLSKMFFTGILSSIIAITMGVGVVFDFFLNVKINSQRNNNLILEQTVGENKIIHLNWNTLQTDNTFLPFSTNFINISMGNVKIVKSNDDKIKLKIHTSTHINSKNQQYLQDYLKGFSVAIENGFLKIRVNKDESKHFPLLFINGEIQEIAIPEGVHLKTQSYNKNQVKNFIIPEKYRKYEKYIQYCYDFIYDKDGKLYCNFSETEGEQILQNAVKMYLNENKEQIMPLKFNKESYFWDGVDLKSIKDNKVNFDMSDGYTNFELEGKIIEDNNGFSIENVNIINMSGSEPNKKYYKNPEIISSLIKKHFIQNKEGMREEIYENLYSLKTDYIGDNSKVANIIKNQAYPEDIITNGIHINSQNEPYTLEINLVSQNKIDRNSLWKNAAITFALIGNLGNIEYRDNNTIVALFTREEVDKKLQDEGQKASEETGKSKENFKEFLDTYSKLKL